MKRTTCGQEGFNYCKWAKIIVAIPALPLIVYIAVLPYEHPLLQITSAIAAITFTIAGAIWIDDIELLKKKFRRGDN